ncbi:hypothetical protein OSG_eHP30_00135 [environmental Halophage eHP-30]|nr:hypothetical protein OSG_eHP30_00135 [environmental Halophage eHP-30]
MSAKYKLNYYNPLFYLIVLVGLILVSFASPFHDESLGHIIKENLRNLKNPDVEKPRLFALWLKIVIRK